MTRVLMFAMLLTMVSCVEKSVSISKSEPSKEITFPSYSKANNYSWQVIKCSDGHDYLESDGNHSYIIMHYVECKKCKK